ncbi:MAG: hypothetical protein PCFJNLEI_00098 [Verrucomicrobiae bacterium]|nr:hypothetical protein [Verrucomicrobiae bacterium]
MPPRIYILGDSISLGYTPEVATLLANRAIVTHNPGNAMFSAFGRRSLPDWLGSSRYDVIHFNWGIWDLHRLQPSADPLEPSVNAFLREGVRRTTPEQYAANLEAIIAILKNTGAKLIWATTTPLRDNGELCCIPVEVVHYNSVAHRIMTAHHIPINDLYSRALPELDRLLSPDGCHFTADGYRYLGACVAGEIAKVL